MKKFITLIFVMVITLVSVNAFAQDMEIDGIKIDLNSTEVDKAQVEKFITSNLGLPVTVMEVGDLQDIPYVDEIVSTQSINMLKKSEYMYDCMIKALDTKNRTSAVKILMDCLDNIDNFRKELLPDETRKYVISLVANPADYIGSTNSNFKTFQGRKVTYTMPDGSIETNVILYVDNEMLDLYTSSRKIVIRYLDNLKKFYKTANKLMDEIINWKRGVYY